MPNGIIGYISQKCLKSKGKDVKSVYKTPAFC